MESDTETDTRTHRPKYCNPRCACTLRVNTDSASWLIQQPQGHRKRDSQIVLPVIFFESYTLLPHFINCTQTADGLHAQHMHMHTQSWMYFVCTQSWIYIDTSIHVVPKWRKLLCVQGFHVYKEHKPNKNVHVQNSISCGLDFCKFLLITDTVKNSPPQKYYNEIDYTGYALYFYSLTIQSFEWHDFFYRVLIMHMQPQP